MEGISLLLLLLIIINSVCVLIFIAFFTTFERKVMGAIQRRVGPNVVGTYGLLQSIADGLKLALKETLIVKESAKSIFIIAPILTFAISLINWALLPFNEQGSLSNPQISVIFYLCLSSLGVYGIILAGWSSNSKYSFLGCIRSTAQLVSYEVIFAFTIFPLFIFSNSASLHTMVFGWLKDPSNALGDSLSATSWPIWFLFVSSTIFCISALAETNRTPFDLPEAEAELVAGYNIEYSSLSFALFFLGEYSSMGTISVLFSLLYLGSPVFISKIASLLELLPFSMIFGYDLAGGNLYLWRLIGQSFGISLFSVGMCFFFIWVRGTLPRYRFDQLIKLCWIRLLPIILTFIILIAVLLLAAVSHWHI